MKAAKQIQRFILLSACCFVLSQHNCFAQSIFQYAITTLDGQQHTLQEYAGKNILIVVLPSVANAKDTAVLDSAVSVAITYKDSLTVIGIPSYEDDYYDDSLPSLTAWYDSLTNNAFVIAQGMSTRKTSAYQNALFAWLTNYAQNGHFDEDVQGVSEMFFIDTSGNLFAVYGTYQTPTNKLVQQVLQQKNAGQ